MKKNSVKAIVAASMALCLMPGCNRDAYDGYECYKTVVSSYPGDVVISLPDEKFRFIVKKEDGSIVYVKTMDPYSTKITYEYTAIPASPSKPDQCH
jgi:hypothetical protein